MFPLRDARPSPRTPWFAWATILVCVVGFALERAQPGLALVENGGFHPAHLSALAQGQGDALVLLTPYTSTLLHGGLLHLAGNAWFLHVFGDRLEGRWGTARFGLFYVLAAYAAAFGEWLRVPQSTQAVVGASGPLAAVMTAWLWCFPRARVRALLPTFRVGEAPAWALLLGWIALESLGAILDPASTAAGAHAGGAVAGVLLGAAMERWVRLAPTERVAPAAE